MKKYVAFLFSIFTALLTLSSPAFAVTGININHAYAKSDGSYTVVVKEAPNTALALYVNDHNPIFATANKKSWATFRGVKLAGDNGKISFTRVYKANHKTRQKPINYVRYYAVTDAAVSFLASKPVEPPSATTVKSATPPPAATPTPAVQAAPQPNCTNGSYVNSAGNRVCSPETTSSAPAGATAQCVDGTYSFSQSHRGTCSHHGGVASWL